MSKSQPDERPAAWVGHIALRVPDVKASKVFFMQLGMRDVEPDLEIAILELRGGTHLLLLPSAEEIASDAVASFDIMLDDLDGAHQTLSERGHEPSAIEDGTIHRSFQVEEPGGHTITINSSHASGRPV